jgi:hypothetical protein
MRLYVVFVRSSVFLYFVLHVESSFRASTERTMMNSEWNGMCKEVIVIVRRVCAHILQEWLRRTTKKLKKMGNFCPACDSNQEPPEYSSETLSQNLSHFSWLLCDHLFSCTLEYLSRGNERRPLLPGVSQYWMSNVHVLRTENSSGATVSATCTGCF